MWFSLAQLFRFLMIIAIHIPRFVMSQNSPLCRTAHNVDIWVTYIDWAHPLTAGINHPDAATVPAAAQRQRYQAGC